MRTHLVIVLVLLLNGCATRSRQQTFQADDHLMYARSESAPDAREILKQLCLVAQMHGGALQGPDHRTHAMRIDFPSEHGGFVVATIAAEDSSFRHRLGEEHGTILETKIDMWWDAASSRDEATLEQVRNKIREHLANAYPPPPGFASNPIGRSHGQRKFLIRN